MLAFQDGFIRGSGGTKKSPTSDLNSKGKTNVRKIDPKIRKIDPKIWKIDPKIQKNNTKFLTFYKNMEKITLS